MEGGGNLRIGNHLAEYTNSFWENFSRKPKIRIFPHEIYAPLNRTYVMDRLHIHYLRWQHHG